MRRRALTRVLYTFIPYAPEDQSRNLGWAYNRFMSLLPDDDDWACFLDHDAMFTTRGWYSQIVQLTQAYPRTGCFTAMTNRVGNPAQIHGFDRSRLREGVERVPSIFETLERSHNHHDLMRHREIGAELMRTAYADVEVLGPDDPMSGVVMVVRKQVWNTLKFVDGFLGVDRAFHEACNRKGLDVILMRGVYVYHWYRGDGDIGHVAEFF